ncbi:saccharopine dehydrogenase NADP-binding domain-containing protein [Photorhabdus bodei]|uniref:Saccharopine dehydrogenase NADP-binding domain-containing protein n=1 Tax=Photorhabdus bodei TaxID=2029681 RepID=A0AAW6BPD8_9GAMM|nr:saccharopine dehydrogenase NADP-binding domain-containing protein [Photorhabdus bodei]MDB6374583.1 saccharopine dehydrogenase NADP-binding domain-containing protein [Photorhabdus bodei]
MSYPTIAIVGAQGSIGQALVAALHHHGMYILRLGSRHSQNELPFSEPPFLWRLVDGSNIESINAFIHGCDLVVNCSGPFHNVGLNVVKAAIEQRIDVIDVNAGYPELIKLRQQFSEVIERHHIHVVVGCGLMPGLTEALPLWACTQVQGMQHLRFVLFGHDKFTHAAVSDVIVAAKQRLKSQFSLNTNMAHHTLPTNFASILPEVTEFIAYQDDELDFIKKVTGVRTIEAWIGYLGKRTQSALKRALAMNEVAQAATVVVNASIVDLAERPPFQHFLCELLGEHKQTLASLQMRGQSASELCAAAIATVIEGILTQKITSGAYLGSQVLSESWAIQSLRSHQSVSLLHLVKGTLYTTPEEGVI